MINNSNFLLGEIPKFHPIIDKYNMLSYYKDVKRKMFEGEWSGGRWCPPELWFHVNISTIKFLGGGRKASGVGKPWFRDIDWEKGYIYSEACGFSGFINDPEYTCLRDVQTLTKEEIYHEFCQSGGTRIERNYKSLFKPDGTLKKYMPARTYLYRTDMSSDFGQAIYLNQAKNVLEMGGRGYGKSYFTASCIQHSLLTDDSRFYEDYLEGRRIKQCKTTAQVLVGAIEAKYSEDLISKVKFSLDNLPGRDVFKMGGEYKEFTSPLLPELDGSWVIGAKNPIHDVLSGSSVIHRTFRDNPLAANGTRPQKVFLEEIGFFSSIFESIGAIEATQPNRLTNKYMPIYMLGTGGYTTTGTALWLKKIFYEPEQYDCLAFEDVWENKGKIGYFVPASKGLNDFKEGPNYIANEERAVAAIEKARVEAAKSNEKATVLSTIINQPIRPSEVFMTEEGNFFPAEDLRDCLERLESTQTTLSQTYKVEFSLVDGKVKMRTSNKPVIREFPLKNGVTLDTAIELFEPPKRLASGDVPQGRYLASWDPIELDGNTDYGQSLQSIFVLDSWTDRIVAEYTGRTYIATDFYEQARRLFTYYNASCNYENNVKGPYAYFLNKNSLHLLCDTPDILTDKSLVKSSAIGNKSKGTRVSGNKTGSGVINFGINEALEWLESSAYDKPEGTRVMDTIQSPALLRELIGYSPQINCDRVSSLVLLMIIRADRQRITEVSKSQSIKTKASDPIFRNAYRKNVLLPKL